MNNRTSRTSEVRAAKLRAIRLHLGLTQTEILARVAPEMNSRDRVRVSMWERHRREPYSEVLIRYAQLIDVDVAVLIRDDLALPPHIASATNGSTAPQPDCPAQQPEANPRKLSESATEISGESPIADRQTEQFTVQADDPAVSPDTADDNRQGQTPNAAESDPPKSVDESPPKHSILSPCEPEPREAITLLLRSAFLDRLTELHLDILRTIPRRLHKSLNVEELIALCLGAAVNQHRVCDDRSFLAREVAAYVEKLTDYNDRKTQNSGSSGE